MTGYQSKKAMAQDKLDDDDDTQVYKDHGVALHSIKHPPGLMDEMALTIAYQSGYYDGKKAAQPAQEPVVLHWQDRWGCNHYVDPKEPHPVNAKPLYTAPPQRTWVGLTDDELAELSASGLALWDLWRAIEAKLKEKNNEAV